MITGEKLINRSTVISFLGASLLWLVLSVAVCLVFSVSPKWAIQLWAMSVVDLWALAKALSAVFGLVGVISSSQNRQKLVIQAFYWGTVKLACLGLFAVVLIKAKSIPSLSLVIGLGTMVTVPLLGGLIYSVAQRVVTSSRFIPHA